MDLLYADATMEGILAPSAAAEAAAGLEGGEGVRASNRQITPGLRASMEKPQKRGSSSGSKRIGGKASSQMRCLFSV